MNKKNLSLAAVILFVVLSIYLLERPSNVVLEDKEEIKNEIRVETTQGNGSNNSLVKNNFLPEEVYIPDASIISEKSKYVKAPELAGISGFINSDEFTLSELRGKVVLIDFWTYSCINCIRTQPYLNAWYETYADNGLVIVGVHTPEFEFEKNYDNVKNAVTKAGIKYPVVQDNEFQTWSAYRNRYWPRKYLIDIDGFIRYDRIGEGGYDETENVIKEILGERKERLNLDTFIDEKSQPSEVVIIDPRGIGTPEIYFGYKFTRGNFGSSEGFSPDSVTSYKAQQNYLPNKAYLAGDWLNKADYSELVGENGKVIIEYSAKVVNIVASSKPAAELKVLLDGKAISPTDEGGDTIVEEEKLYKIVDSPEYATHMLEIQVSNPGFRLYTFTFG